MKNCKNLNKQNLVKLAVIILFILNELAYSQTKYSSPDPFLIIGDDNDISSSQEITNKISQIQNQNKELRAKVISLQDLLISRFKDRIEVKVEIESRNEKGLPQFGFVELNATINNVPIINYTKPIFFEKNMRLPIFNGPLPNGRYEIKIQGLVGQQNNNWPYVIPQGKWSVEKKVIIDGNMTIGVHNIKLILKPKKENGIPELEVDREESLEKK